MVTIRVQHRVGRDEPLARLLSLLPPAVEVVADSGEIPNPWRGYQRCLSNLPPDGHVCVLQDDTIPCRNFQPAIERIADAFPDAPVCLFVGGLPLRTANLLRQASIKRRAYTAVVRNDFMPVVAVLWPVHVAAGMLEWMQAHPKRLGNREQRSDDAMCGKWMRFSHQPVYATVPSLVEHDDVFPSTIGKKNSAGANKGRVAALWIGDGDPLEIDWTRPRGW